MVIEIEFSASEAAAPGANPGAFEDDLNFEFMRLREQYRPDAQLSLRRQPAPSNVLGVEELITWVLEYPEATDLIWRFIRHAVTAAYEIMKRRGLNGKLKIRINDVEFEIDGEYQSLAALRKHIDDQQEALDG